MGRFVLIRKKERYTLTWFGRLCALAVCVLLVWVYAITIVTYLSPNDPVKAKLLVVEGYLPDYAMEEAMELFQAGDYEHMVITGKAREKGAHLDQYANDGEYAAATLLKLGFDPEKLSVVATDNDIRKDRTYASALAAKEWIEKNRPEDRSLDLVSAGTHSRRSRYLFEKAFPKNYKIGIYAIPSRSFDADNWWKSSHGFREINKETIAWVYAKLFFYP